MPVFEVRWSEYYSKLVRAEDEVEAADAVFDLEIEEGDLQDVEVTEVLQLRGRDETLVD